MFSLHGDFPAEIKITCTLGKYMAKFILNWKIFHWPLHNYDIFMNAAELKLETKSSPCSRSEKGRKIGLRVDVVPLTPSF